MVDQWSAFASERGDEGGVGSGYAGCEHKVSSSSLIELEDMATNRIDELKVQLCQQFNELICTISLRCV
jgi:hypothetical protein